MLTPTRPLRGPGTWVLGALAGLWLTTVGAIGQDPISVMWGDGQASRADFEAVRQDLEKVREQRIAQPNEVPEVQQTLLAAIDEQLTAVKALTDVLASVESVNERKAGLQGEIEAVRSALGTVRLESQTPPAFASMSEEELNRLTADAAARSAERRVATEALEQAERRVTEGALTAVNGRVESLTAAWAPLREAQGAAAEGPEKALATRRAAAAEARLRRAELERDHNVALQEIDRLQRDLARLKLDLASERTQRSEALLVAARAARELDLAKEAERDRAEAERQRRAAALSRSPAEKAVRGLQALAQQLQAEAKDEAAVNSRWEGLLAETQALQEQIDRRNTVVAKLLPEGSDLDGWRLDALEAEQRRLVARSDQVRALRVRRSEIATALAALIEERDRVERLKDLVDRRHEGALEDAEQPMLGLGPNAQAWVTARAAWETGKAELEPAELSAFVDRFSQAESALDEVLRTRLAAFDQREIVGTKILESIEALGASVENRQRHLRLVSFWLRDPPLWDRRELTGLRDDLASAGERVLTLPGGAAQFVGSLGGTPLGFLGWGALTAAALTLIVGYGGRVQRALRAWLRATEEDEEQEQAGFLRLLAGVLARNLVLIGLMIPIGFLCLHAFPEELAFAFLFAGLLAVIGVRASRDLASAIFAPAGDGLVTCSPKVARLGRRSLLWLLTTLSIFLPAAWLATRSGWPHLGRFLGVPPLVAGLLLASRALFTPELTRSMVPESSDTLIRRTLRRFLPFFWPSVLVFAGFILVLQVLGYRTAAWHYGSRTLVSGAILVAGVFIYQAIGAVIRNWAEGDTPGTEEGEPIAPDDEHVDFRSLVARALNGVLSIGILVAQVLLIARVIDVSREDWQSLGRTVVVDGEDSPLTLGGIVTSILILVFGLALARFVRDALQVLLGKYLERGSRYAVRTLVFYSLVGIVILFSLSSLGLNLAHFGWFLTAAGVGIGFGLQEIISNFIAGLILFFERPVQVGDIVTIGSVEGDVKRINIRSTVVRTRDGISIIIPNKRLVTDDVINWSHGDQRTRLHVPISIAYGSDIPVVKRVVLEVAEKEGRALARPRPEVQFRAFGESELQMELLIWLPKPDPTLRNRVLSDLNSAIDAAFRRAGIEIPFPQRDLHVKGWPEMQLRSQGGEVDEEGSLGSGSGGEDRAAAPEKDGTRSRRPTSAG